MDCTGGMQRNERAILGDRGTVRPIGGILYLDHAKEFSVHEIKPDMEAIKEDVLCHHLLEDNGREAFEVLSAVSEWGRTEGIFEEL